MCCKPDSIEKEWKPLLIVTNSNKNGHIREEKKWKIHLKNQMKEKKNSKVSDIEVCGFLFIFFLRRSNEQKNILP